ncbi:hypothetical protein SLT36_25620 [Aminobacter sp. BA135]|uniref:hypothetical protein n=1 Tax=Aminobacter sp. BA135 TaxID=537596 RepID=UPI003D7C00EF
MNCPATDSAVTPEIGQQRDGEPLRTGAEDDCNAKVLDEHHLDWFDHHRLLPVED